MACLSTYEVANTHDMFYNPFLEMLTLTLATWAKPHISNQNNTLINELLPNRKKYLAKHIEVDAKTFK